MPSPRRFASVFVVVIATLFVAATALHAAPPTDSELQAKVDAVAAAALQKPGAAGLSIAIARNGKMIVAKGYGLADVEFDVPADAQTIFRIGSITKQFTSAAIMRLIEQGKLSLDDPMTKFLPDYPMQGNVVTIRNLLNHTSGIKSMTDLGEEWEKTMPLDLTHEQMLALVKDKPFDFKPGDEWRYNNTGYYILGMIIEKITGKSYADYLQEEFFTPLKLDRTSYEVSSEIVRNRARGYSIEKGQQVNAAPLGMTQPYAAGSLISTAEELIEWAMALTSGKVVSPESFQMMITPTVLNNGKSQPYGFGIAIDTEAQPKRIWHNGGNNGFNSMLLWLPDEQVFIAVISNGEPVSADRVGDELVYAALGIEKPVAKDIAITPEVMKQIVGNYKFEQVPMEMKVWEEGGKAMVKANGENQKGFALKWQGPDVSEGREFRAAFDDDTKFMFAADGRSLTLDQRGMKLTAQRVGE